MAEKGKKVSRTIYVDEKNYSSFQEYCPFKKISGSKILDDFIEKYINKEEVARTIEELNLLKEKL